MEFRHVALLGLAITLAACQQAGTPLEKGQWRTSTTYGTPKVDGASIDELRKSLPQDVASTECETPLVRPGSDVMRYFNFRQDKCDMTSATSENGIIRGEATCAGIARLMGGSGEKDAWVKFDGTYGPRFMDLNADFTVTIKSARGETHRATFSATHKTERLGECT